MSQPTQDPHDARPGRKRRRGRLIVLAVLATLAAAVAIYLAPLWLPAGFSDDEHAIAMERAQRRWRWSMNMPMPGEPDLARLDERLQAAGLSEGAPILVRIFKREFELEIWMKKSGAFERFAIYPICTWSGDLGAKYREGDGQAPEGFYSVDQRALNPNSRYFRSFNVGYPNAFDSAHGRTGSFIMVHGSCASVGCFAMTNPQMREIWQLVTSALKGGQQRFQVQIFPFRMTEDRLKSYRGHPQFAFWQSLKAGSDHFEAERLPPRVQVCDGSYAFSPAGVYPDGDGGIEKGCPAREVKS